MLTKDVETMAGAAQGKADICEHYPVKFFIRAIMAGFFIWLYIIHFLKAYGEYYFL